jgi:hypothetical protein
MVPFVCHQATAVLTVANSCETESGFEQRARKFSMMMVCGTSKHVTET